jgi:hypothetical protein
MRIFLAIGISLCMLVSGAQSQTSKEQTIRIVRSASQPSRQGPVENFTGSVRVDPLFQAIAPARASGSLVTFEPGARTAWHTHPLGQILIVTTGTGRVQRWGDCTELSFVTASRCPPPQRLRGAKSWFPNCMSAAGHVSERCILQHQENHLKGFPL